ncbi:hypothetical protein EJ08DRAFT_651129, partial [Tothia fuscella]
FVFLTTTLPASLVPRLCEALLLERPLLIRSVSARADLEYYVIQRDPSSDLTRAAIINIQTRTLADKIANGLGYPIYYSDSSTAEEKAAVLGR